MTKPLIRIHNITTNEIIDREMNDQEFAQYKKDKEIFESEIESERLKKEQREALLLKLGITEDEAKLLL